MIIRCLQSRNLKTFVDSAPHYLEILNVNCFSTATSLALQEDLLQSEMGLVISGGLSNASKPTSIYIFHENRKQSKICNLLRQLVYSCPLFLDCSMWDEIQKLSEQFQKTQKISNNAISETSCVDIIELLSQRKLVELYHSLDGRFYITPPRLYTCVERHIRYYGRATLETLQLNLQIDSYVLSHLLNELIKNCEDICMLHGEVFTRACLEQIYEEICEVTYEKRCIRILDLCSRLDSISLSLFNEVLSMSDSFSKQYKIEIIGNSICSQTYKDLQCSLLLGSLEACISPIDISKQLCSTDLIDANILQYSLEAIKKKHALNGQFIHGYYIPNAYIEKQMIAIRRLLDTNGYIDYRLLNEWKVIDRQWLMQKMFSNKSSFFESCWITSEHLDRLFTEAKSSLMEKGYCNIEELLPCGMPSTDLAKFVETIMKGNAHVDHVIDSIFIVSDELRRNVSDKLMDLGKAIFQKALNDRALVDKLLSKVVNSNSQSRSTFSNQRQERKQKGKKKATVSSPSPISANEKITITDIAQVTPTDLYPTLQLLDLPDALVESFASFYLSTVESFICKKMEVHLSDTIANGNTSTINTSTSNCLNITCNDIFKSLQEVELITRSIEELNNNPQFDDPDFVSELNAYVLNAYCNNLLNVIYNVKLLETCDNMSYEQQDTLKTNKDRQSVIEKFTESNKESLQNLEHYFGESTNVFEFLSYCIATVERLFNVTYRKMDKKQAREVGLETREILKSKLQSEVDLSKALRQAVILILYASNSLYLPITGKMIPAILRIIELSLQEQNSSELTELNEIYTMVRTMIERRDSLVVGADNPDAIAKLKWLRRIGTRTKEWMRLSNR
ncbi:hypothetical protein GJ496_011657 [Pomphorhynchus laevis]|nr:hypothetical protein GJ496_011657 [Pomphorhynchus laevis]